MKIPKGSSKKFDRAAKWLVDLYTSHWAVKYAAGPLLLALPPAIITALYSNPAAKDWLAITHPHISQILTEYFWFFIAFAAIYPTIVLKVAQMIAKRADSNGLSVDGLLALLASLDAIVGCKEARFAKQAASTAPLTKEEAFCKVTNPDTQIAEIVREVCNLFNATRTDKKKNLIRVTLAVIKDDKITEIPIYYPADEPVRSPIESLNKPCSAIQTAIKSKKLVVIEDIRKELQRPHKKRRFIDTGNEVDNAGSIICYPIIYSKTGKIPFVISVHCNDAGYFKNDFKDLYEHSLQRFALRLSLEYSLLQIKEKLCG